MEVRILDKEQTRYGVYDDKGEQIKQGPILPEWRAQVRSEGGLLKIIARHEKVPHQRRHQAVSLEEGAEPDPSDAYFDALDSHHHDGHYAPVEHGHGYATRSDIDAEILPLTQRIEADRLEVRTLLRSEAEARLGHFHADAATRDHAHPDQDARINGLHEQIAFMQSLLDGLAQGFRDQPVYATEERLRALQADLNALSQHVTALATELRQERRDAIEALRQTIPALPDMSIYMTKADYEAAQLKDTGRYHVEEISREERGGKRRWVIEERA